MKADDRTGLAAERGGEDGADPKEFHKKPWNAPKQATRKGQQLCAQVREALHAALGACADPVLQALTVVSVEPAPHTGRLRVLVLVPPDVGRPVAEEALRRAAGFLRSEVARAISRRHAPELAFDSA